MSSINGSVSGIDALNRELERIAREVASTALLPSLASAAGVTADAVRSGAQAHSKTGKMAAALEIGVELASSGQAGEADIGFGDQDAIAMHVEFGHREITHEGADIGQVPAHPFIRPAFDESKDRAIQAFTGTFAEKMSEIIGS